MHRSPWFNIVGVMGGLSALTLISCLYLLTAHMDHAAEADEAARVSARAIANLRTSEISIRAWVRSDEAIRRLDHQRDVGWAMSTFPDIGSADVWTYTLDHADRIISGAHRARDPLNRRASVEKELPGRIRRWRAQRLELASSTGAATDFFWSGGTLYMEIIAPFAAVSPTVRLVHSKPPVLVAVAPYEQFVQSGMAGMGLKKLSVSADPSRGMPVRDFRGYVVGSLSFQPSHPGADTRRVVLWPSLALTLAFIALLVFAHRQADIERRKLVASEQQANYLAFHDQLTGLANRRFLLEALNREVAIAEVSRSDLSLLMIDLDRFKSVNDTFGHDCGDELILEAARRLRSICNPEHEFCARLGGDEFVILAARCSATAAGRLAGRAVDTLARPVLLSAAEIQSGGSIGVACHSPGTAPDALLRSADQALYLAKRDGRSNFRIAASTNSRLLSMPSGLSTAPSPEQFALTG